MNTKPSKITLKKQDLLLRNFSTQSYASISPELSLSRLLYVDFPTRVGVGTQAINLPLQKSIALRYR